jgi:hypothetical protein
METNRNGIRELLTFFWYKDFTRNQVTKDIFPGGKFWKHP